MKKILYIVSSLMVLFTACDPMEDVYEELDAQARLSERKMAFTLSEEDYELAIKNHYFASEAEAAEVIPAILDSKYPQLENGTMATVTYNTLVTAFTGNRVSSEAEHVVTDEDYEALKELGAIRYSNFDSPDDIVAFLNYKYPEAEENHLVELTFAWYNSNTSPSTQDVTDHFYFKNGEWIDAYLVSDEDYVSVNHTRYNFSSSDGDNLPLYLDKFLRENILGAKAGDVQYVSYAYYSSSSRSTSQRVTAMVYNGSNWVELKESVTEEATLTFSKQNGIWVPDLSIRYALIGADYAWIAQQPVGDAAGIASLARYSNFDTSLWPRASIVEALGALLKNKYPNAEVGQKFVVTYIIYSGGTSTANMTLVLNESGEYEAL